MSPILRLAANDVRLTARDRAAFFWLLILPIFLIWIFARVGGGGGANDVSLAVIDRDGGWLASAFLEELAGPKVALKVYRGDQADAPEAKSAARWLTLPQGFTVNALAGKQQKLKIETTENAAADYSRAAEVVVTRAIVRTLARAAEIRGGALPENTATYDALKARPPIVAVETAEAGTGVAVHGLAQSVPGNMTFTVMMMTLIYGAVYLTIEKREGVLRRQMTLPLRRSTIFAGKVLGRWIIAMAQIAILVAAGRFLFRLDFGHSPLSLWAVLFAYAFAVAGIATFLGAILANPEQASTVGWLAATVMGALGGCWWPAEIMPSWLRTAAHIFPTAWAMDGLHAVISFGRGLDAVLVPVAVLAGFGVVFSLLAARKLSGLTVNS
ncbi:MAG TPA: ABC transporter permease [Candidatus Polarisedimenticolaceae bacterium]|nr:ABC transporter permease [Candidatus Polarisedimenticolaceae bacterium]